MAVHFADLHDTPGRMKSKGVIRRQVNWAHSRTYFFWRLRRRLTEFDLANKLATYKGQGTSVAGSRHRREAVADLHSWFKEQGGKAETWEDDRRMMLWLTDNHASFTSYVADKKAQSAAAVIADKVAACDADGLKLAMAALTPEARARLLSALQ